MAVRLLLTTTYLLTTALSATIPDANPNTTSPHPNAPQQLLPEAPTTNPANDFSCTPTTSTPSNPIVMLHGLGSTWYEDIFLLENHLKSLGYCTFSFTYGPEVRLGNAVGGLDHIAVTAPQTGKFIKNVAKNTGGKVDIVGHSEGAFQATYVPKFIPGVSGIVDNIVAIAGPQKGTDFGNLQQVPSLLGPFGKKLGQEILEAGGCGACTDLLIGGAAVKKLNQGAIVQKGNTLTNIISTNDREVTPHQNAFVKEKGVTNLFVQDFCPNDKVGHLGEATDTNVWAMVVNALEGKPRGKVQCNVFGGAPGK